MKFTLHTSILANSARKEGRDPFFEPLEDKSLKKVSCVMPSIIMIENVDYHYSRHRNINSIPFLFFVFLDSGLRR